MFIVTGSDKATWLSEVTHPYWHLSERDVEIDIYSPGANPITWDPLSDPSNEKSAEPNDLVSRGFLSERALVNRLREPMELKSADLDQYDGVHIAGGLGAVFDLYPNPDAARALEFFWSEGKTIGAICHGGIALANIPHRIRGRHVTSYTRAEDRELEGRLAGSVDIPQYPQKVIESTGAVFESVGPHGVCVVKDGMLVTGQNQQSASEYGLTLFHTIAGRDPLMRF